MAIPSTTDLRTEYPEFSNAPEALAQAKVDRALSLTDEAVYGDQFAHAVLLRAADMLARSPFARSMQLVSKDGSTLYSLELARLTDINGCCAAGVVFSRSTC